jgi:hypothetical protein
VEASTNRATRAMMLVAAGKPVTQNNQQERSLARHMQCHSLAGSWVCSGKGGQATSLSVSCVCLCLCVVPCLFNHLPSMHSRPPRSLGLGPALALGRARQGVPRRQRPNGPQAAPRVRCDEVRTIRTRRAVIFMPVLRSTLICSSCFCDEVRTIH